MKSLRIVNVPIPERTYPIIIGSGARLQLRQSIEKFGAAVQIVVIADEHVAELHLSTLLESLPTPAVVVLVPPGEQSKSLSSVERLYGELADARISRGDLILAFGGGVIGDLAGFVAATWMRGANFLQLPTTLLAAIDASCGGKTGVNHAAGKNLIGAFHQPAAVIADTDFLVTLSERDYRAGLAESVKHAAIRDAAFLAWHEEHSDRLAARDEEIIAELIARNCEIKAEIVSVDERESGIRMILNHGHTMGHAFEHLLEYELRHGECVALGMIVENELALARELLNAAEAERVARLLARLGLPVKLPRGLGVDRVVEVVRMDKKARDGKVNFVLLRAPGSPLRVDDVSAGEIATALRVVGGRS